MSRSRQLFLAACLAIVGLVMMRPLPGNSLPAVLHGSYLNTLINNLTRDGVWANLDSLYILAQPNANLAGIDLVKPSRTLTVSGSPTFTASKGYTGDGVSAFLDTNYNPATQAVNFSQNANTFGIWSLSANADATSVFDYGQADAAIAPYSLSVSEIGVRSSSATSDALIAFQSTAGFYASSRQNSTGFTLFKNAASLYQITSASNSGNVYHGHGQGWATDGTYYYTTTTNPAGIWKIDPNTLAVVGSNLAPFAGLSGTVNHLGAPSAVVNGKIYIPVQNWSGSCGGSNSNNQIIEIDTTTLSLVQSAQVTLTGNSGNAGFSAIGVDPSSRLLYGADFCDNTLIYRFNQASFAQLSSIPLQSGGDFNFVGLQGIAPQNGLLYLSGQSAGSVGSGNRWVPVINLSGQVVEAMRQTETTAAIEGINFNTDGTLGIVQDDASATTIIYFYQLPTTASATIARTSAAITSQTMTVFKRNGASAFSNNQLALVFAGNLTNAQLALAYADFHQYLLSVGAVSQ